MVGLDQGAGECIISMKAEIDIDSKILNYDIMIIFSTYGQKSVFIQCFFLNINILYIFNQKVCSIRTRNQSRARTKSAPTLPCAFPRADWTDDIVKVPHEPLACSLSSADKTEVWWRSRSTHRRSRLGVAFSSGEEFVSVPLLVKSLFWTIFHPKRCQPVLLRDPLHPQWLPHRQVPESPRRTNTAPCQKTER